MFKTVEAEGHRGLTLPLFEGEKDVLHLFGFRGPDPLRVIGRFWGPGERPVVLSRQVHGDRILVLKSSKGAGHPDGYDALITHSPGLILTVRTADCIPLLLWDRGKKAAGAVHAGWRGSLSEITRKTVEAMGREFGSSPGDLIAGIGPAAGPCCYEVDAPVLEPLRRNFAYWEEVVRGAENGRARLNLAELNRRQLLDAGLRPERIQNAGVCTICHKEKFPSFRREGTAGEGMLAGIMKKD